MNEKAEVIELKEVVSFAGEVWDTLSHVDCSKHVKDKGGFTYLSWVWAWGILMERYPDSSYSFAPVDKGDDGTCTVACTVVVRNGALINTSAYRSVQRDMWLPVLDFRNKAIPNPDAFQLNSAKMRCLVKTIAMHGLGHFIYAGEDLPREQDAADIHRWGRGEKEELILQVNQLIDADDGMGIKQIFEEYGDDPSVKNKAWHLFDSATRTLMAKMIKELPVETPAEK